MVPREQGPFHLDDYVAYVQEFIRHIGPEVQRDLGLPADGAGAGGDLADGERRRADAAHDDDDGRPDRRPQEPDRGQQPGDEQEPRAGSRTTSSTACRSTTRAPGARVYPGFLQHAGFVAMNPDRHLKSHYDYFLDLVRGDDEKRRVPPRVLRRVQRRARHAGRVLPRHHQDRVPGLRARQRHLGGRRPAGAAAGHHDDRAADDRRRARRHLRRRPDPRRARPVHRHPGRPAVPLRRRRRRPLRHLLGPPLAREGLSAGARLHRPHQPKDAATRASRRRSAARHRGQRASADQRRTPARRKRLAA